MPTSSPPQAVEMQEVAFILVADDLNPGMLNLDFLKLSGIVPTDWEVTQAPSVGPGLAQFNFTNGVNLVAQPRSATFLEALADKSPQDLQAPRLARRYLDKLPHGNYRGLTITPRLLLGFPAHEDAARRFITERLLAPGPWQDIGRAPLRASLTLNYQLPHCAFSVAINEVRLQQTADQSIAALLFAGSFNYGLEAGEPAAKLQALHQWLANWHGDLETFQTLISQRFLKLAPTNPPPPASPPRSSSLFPQL